jgi:antitoxin (DNA-binding transcriptional repressor) of toxin-antitoxin stability system
MLEHHEEVIITDHGRPVAVLKPVGRLPATTVVRVDYYGRLKGRMPKPLRRAKRKALDEADRDER